MVRASLDNIEFVIEILQGYKVYKAEIRDIEYLIKDLEAREQLRGLGYSERVKTYTVSNQVEALAIDTIDKVTMLNLHKEHCIRQIERVNNALDALNDDEKTIVRMKYIESKRWYDITYAVKLGERQCRRMNRQALNKIANILNMCV